MTNAPSNSLRMLLDSIRFGIRAPAHVVCLASLLLNIALQASVHAASLTGASAPLTSPTNIDLTAEGRLDWAHRGLLTEQSFNHKYGVKQQIQYSFIAGKYDGPYRLNETANGCSWSDGTPFQMATNTGTKIYILGRGNGFQIQCPADTHPRHLKIYVGVFAGRSTLTATLKGVPTFSDSSLDSPSGSSNGVYSLDFAASSASQSLTVAFTLGTSYDAQNGNVVLRAATLSGDDDPPVVRIIAPDDGAAFAAPANFSITATALDNDGVVTNLTLLEGNRVVGQSAVSASSNFLKIALSSQPTNLYRFSASATDDQGLAITSAPVTVSVITGGGTLAANFATPGTNVNLTTAGALDWARWGLNSATDFDYKTFSSRFIPNHAVVGQTTALLNQYGDNLTGFTWTDGTPTLSASNTTNEVFIYGLHNGFQITLPAINVVRRLKLFVGLYGAQGQLDAGLSDWSATPYSDASLHSAYGNAYHVYTLDFSSPNPGTTLSV